MPANWFVAWPVDAPAIAERLRGTPEGVRLLAPGDLHVTLAFLGPVDEARALAALDAIEPATLDAVTATFGAVGVMGHPRRGTALSAVVRQGREALEAVVAARRARALVAAGAPPEERAPLAHLTVARIGRRARAEERRAAIRWTEHVDLSGIGATLDRIALYTWSEDRRAAQYRIVQAHALAATRSTL